MNVEEAAIIGVVMPPVVSFLKNENWNSKVTFALSMLVCWAVVAVVQAIQGDFLSWHDFVVKGATTWATAQAVYALYFGGTAVEKKLASVKVLPG